MHAGKTEMFKAAHVAHISMIRGSDVSGFQTPVIMQRENSWEVRVHCVYLKMWKSGSTFGYLPERTWSKTPRGCLSLPPFTWCTLNKLLFISYLFPFIVLYAPVIYRTCCNPKIVLMHKSSDTNGHVWVKLMSVQKSCVSLVRNSVQGKFMLSKAV